MQSFIKVNCRNRRDQKIFNEIRNKFSKSTIKEVRRDSYKKEKELENGKEKERRQHAEQLRIFEIFLRRFQKKIKKLLQTKKN